MSFDRRTYLKGTAAAAVLLGGLGGASTVLGHPGRGGPPGSGSGSGGGSGPPGSAPACPAGTTPLARYEVNGGGVQFVEGDDVVSFSGVGGPGPATAFEWEATDLVAVVSARAGPDRTYFEGGFEGSVDVGSGGPPVSSVTFCAPRGGRAVLCELDLNGHYDTDFSLPGDPAGVEFSRDEIAQAKYNSDFDELSPETTLQVQAIFNRQPFPDGTGPGDVHTREEIARDRYGGHFNALNRARTIEVQNDYDRQFGPLPSGPATSLDTISQAKHGHPFVDLSIETTGQVQAIYNRQPFSGDATAVRTREEIAEDLFGFPGEEADLPDELDREQLVAVQNAYDEQFGPTPRTGVVCVTSDGTTQDYAHAMVNVASRLDERIHLGKLRGLTFDYYEGSENTGSVPDELFVTLLTPEGDAKLAVTHVGEEGPVEEWQSVDVFEAIENRDWKVEDVSLADLRTGQAAAATARSLRDGPDEEVVLGDEFPDATLLGVGFGAGNTRKPTTIERCFDDIVVEWHPGDESGSLREETFDFPALLELAVDDVTTRGQGQLRVDLSFADDPEGVDLEDVVPESVKLNAFGAFAAPTEPGVAPQQVRVEDGVLRLRFQLQRVEEVLDGESHFLLSGDFDVPTGTSFFAAGGL
ncbi:hypothetical protein [Salinirussus salinus]|uniref:hypothetical protein n=1 Tax=Salinirussus salinus TaxID=1198300 RepID=UPI0013573989|nr:hypothetical protein [Salinirussus salinus]